MRAKTFAPRYPDTELIAQIRNGDANAFEQLIFTYHNRLSHYLTYAVGDVHAAEDILQELYLRLWRHRMAIPADANLNLYLHSVARHRLLDYLRSTRRAAGKADAYGVWMASTEGDLLASHVPDSVLEQQDLAHAVQTAVHQLPERAREIWYLHREQELSYQDIATLLGISVNTVKTQMLRAGRAIREAVTPFLK